MTLLIGGLRQFGYLDETGNSSNPSDSSNGFGFVRCSDTTHTASHPQLISANTSTLLANDNLMFPNDPALYLLGATNHTFVQNSRFMPNNTGDTYDLRLSFSASTTVSSSSFTLGLSIPSIVEMDSGSFPFNAGQTARFTFNYFVFCLDTFKTNGGGFYLTSSADMQIWGVNLVIFPVTLR